MELRRQSCVLPSNAPALPDSSLQEPIIPSRVLQERSGNRRHTDYYGADVSTSWKHAQSSPTENLYSNGLRTYFTSHGNITSQLNGEKSEDQVNYESAKLWDRLRRSEAYRKYREKQDPNDPKQQDQRWPEHMEYAFFRALVRWPPMGRRKHMLNGKLRGRNELIADAIYNDTGVSRTRKQVSSHIQVLKPFFKEHHEILKYMSAEDSAKKQRHASSNANLIRSRHAADDISTGVLKYHSYDLPSQTTQNIWQGCGPLTTPQMLASSNLSSASCPSPYTPVRFGMYVRVDANDGRSKKEIHTFTQLAEHPKLEDIHVHDIRQWHKQFPELSFVKVEEWQSREVIVCDASIQLMEENLPSGAELSVSFEMKSKRDLTAYSDLQCRTRFYDNGKLDPKESLTSFDYDSEHRGLSVPFGSSFWVLRMSFLSKQLREARTLNKQAQKIKLSYIRQNLQFLTAVQELYATRNGTNDQKCVLTVLWRFNQARSSEEGGKTTWRSVRFSSLIQPLHWNKSEDLDGLKEFTAITQPQGQVNTNYNNLPLQFPLQSFSHQNQPFNLDHISTIGLDNTKDFSQPHSASAPSIATELSATHSLPSLSHSQDTSISHPQDMDNANDIDFTGGHINICLEPAISLGAYENFSTTHGNPLNPLHALAGLDHTNDDSNAFGDMGLGVSMGGYSNRPWPYPEMLERMEGLEAGITHNGEMSDHMHGHDIGSHSNNAHDGQVETGLWKLQSPFTEHTAVGGGRGVKDEDLPQEQDHGAILGLGEVGNREKVGRALFGF